MAEEPRALTVDDVGDEFVAEIDHNGLWNPEFLPRNAYNYLIRPKDVRATISSHFRGTDVDFEPLVRYSINNKRVFLICVISKHVPWINEFSRAGFSDNSLPVHGGPEKNGSTIYSSHQTQPWDCFNGEPWDREERRHFINYQWAFFPFTFKGDNFSFGIERQRPMPYRQLEDKSARGDRGHYGKVYKVGLLADHLQTTPPRYLSSQNSNGDYEVAVKQLAIEGAEVGEIEKYYNREKETLRLMREIDDQHLIQAIAAYERHSGKPEKYFVFPWASQGNLRGFWRDNSHAKDNPALISWVLNQMKGLAKALSKLHEKNTRHGDIKPENILIFSTAGKSPPTLVIADVGIAKFHAEETRKRQKEGYITTNSTGTLRYEPPEIELRPGQNIPRRFDVWSLGCVLLEFIIWLLHGSEGQSRFNEELRTKEPRLQRFWHVDGKRNARYPVCKDWFNRLEKRNSCIHPVVKAWIKKLGQDSDQRGIPVLKSLLKLVRDRLLVGSVEPEADPRKQRAHAKEMHDKISEIEGNCLYDSSSLRASTILTDRREQPPTAVVEDEVLALSQDKLSGLIDRWETVTDPNLASWLLSRLDGLHLQPSADSSSHPCSFCANLDFGSSKYELNRNLDDLRSASSECAVCHFLYRRLSVNGATPQDHLTLYRDASTIRISPDGPPVVSLYCDMSAGSNAPTHPYAQLGLPVLPGVLSTGQLTLLKSWLHLCDMEHQCLAPARLPEAHATMPTRVIDVGGDGGKPIRLVEAEHTSTQRYLALSHRWGALNENEKFCTYDDNIEDLRKAIPYDRLPKTFQDAVRLTRALQIQYLWIDSICIIQKNKEDWEKEAKKMEHVFRNAYCTIAASSADSSLKGFLGEMHQRDVVSIQTPSGLLHLAEAIDDFSSHVEDSVLSSRGWVLQERALSRRTIYFTTTQIYWECGRGVFCETLAWLRNPKSQLLGDNNFPSIGLRLFKDDRIRMVQYLYQKYSALSLSVESDRSKAILGLQTHVGRTFASGAQYGVLWRWLERTLLWHAEAPRALAKIEYSPGNSVPSWSWMAYYGRIDFLNTPFRGVEWTGHIRPPESRLAHWDGRLEVDSSALTIESPELMKRALLDEQDHESADSSWQCVVVGKRKEPAEGDEVTHYVLLVRPVFPENPDSLFVRVGIATLLTRHVSLKTRSAFLI